MSPPPLSSLMGTNKTQGQPRQLWQLLNNQNANAKTRDYYANIQRRIVEAGARLPEWGGRQPRFDGALVTDPSGATVNLQDDAQMVAYVTGLEASAKSAPTQDVVQSFVAKAAASRPGVGEYVALPEELRSSYGIAGVDLATLTAGEKLLLKRMGVDPAAKK